MARYRKVDVRMWRDEKFRRLSVPPPSGRECWQFLLTNPFTSNIPGLYAAYPEAMARELRWPVEGFLKAFQEPFREGLAKADWESGLVFIPGAIKYNPPENPNVVKSWASAWDELPECGLKEEAFKHIKAFLKGLGEGFEKPFQKGFGKGMANQDQEQEQEQEEEKKEPPPPLALAPGVNLGKPENKTQRKIVDHWLQPALQVLEQLNAARKRVIAGARDIRPTYSSLGGIAARLDAGKTCPECLAVIENCENEVRRRPDSAKWFDAVSPWRPENFERHLAANPITDGDGAQGDWLKNHNARVGAKYQ